MSFNDFLSMSPAQIPAVNKYCGLLFCLAMIAAWPVFGQVKPGTYASINSFEKVCLRLNENQQFQLFSSNCTIDRDFEGRWKTLGDTLVLNANNGPTMELGQVLESEAIAPLKSTTGEALATDQADAVASTKLVLRSMDAPLLSSIRVKMGGLNEFPNASGELNLKPPIDTIYLYMEGMGELSYTPKNFQPAEIKVEIRFRNLDKPSLFNDRWMQEGRKLKYLPGPGSNRSAEIELVRGKRCFYKLPK